MADNKEVKLGDIVTVLNNSGTFNIEIGDVGEVTEIEVNDPGDILYRVTVPGRENAGNFLYGCEIQIGRMW